MTRRIVVITAEACPNCDSTMNWLNNAGIGYETKDITNDDEMRTELRNLGHRSLPVVRVYDGDELVKTWEGLKLIELKTLKD